MTPDEELTLLAGHTAAAVDGWLRGGTASAAIAHDAEQQLDAVQRLRAGSMVAAPQLTLAVTSLCLAAIAGAHAGGVVELQWRAVAALQISIIRSLGRQDH